MSNSYPSKLYAPVQYTSKDSPIMKSRKSREELREKIDNWKKKAWFDFCKLVMYADKRYTLMPLSDYNNKTGKNSMLSRTQNADGIFSNFCLTRTGTLTDIYILPCDPMLGINIDAGSTYSKATVTSFPSQGMVIPTLCIADELERQYIKEVSIESNKHRK